MRVLLSLVLMTSAAGCAATSAGTPHGRASSLSAASSEDARFCEHQVPEENCVLCHPELAQKFKDAGDWCGEHGVPESQCRKCHPDLSFTPIPKPPPGADLKILSAAGEDVEALEPHAAPGKVTVFDFYADWCAPCREVDARMMRLLHERTDVAYRKLNVVSWETPLAQRYLAKVPSLPYVVVYGRDGRQVAAIAGLDVEKLERAIAEGSAR